MKSYSVAKTAEILGVCTRTIKNWIYSGILNTFKTPYGYHRITETEINKLIKVESNKVILYSRVSSYQQKDDLIRQKQVLIDYAKNNNYEVIIELSDIASGLNDKRKSLIKALALIRDNKANKIVITHKDRLTRFGYNYIEFMVNSFNSSIEPINDDEIKEDYIKDLINIITCFCSKLYSRRSKKEIKEVVSKLL